MNIDGMTIGQFKELSAMLTGGGDTPQSPHIGKKCIIRTYASGVHFGTITAQSGRQVEIAAARRLWRWDAAPHGISLSEIANHGTVGARSRLCEVVEVMTVLDALELTPCTETAIGVIESAEIYTP